MYLTDKSSGMSRSPKDHEELEVLLESFSKQVEEIVNEAESISVSLIKSSCTHENECLRVKSNMQSTQEIVELILDSNRNALLALDLKVLYHHISSF